MTEKIGADNPTTVPNLHPDAHVLLDQLLAKEEANPDRIRVPVAIVAVSAADLEIIREIISRADRYGRGASGVAQI